LRNCGTNVRSWKSHIRVMSRSQGLGTRAKGQVSRTLFSSALAPGPLYLNLEMAMDEIVPIENIATLIYHIRGQRVMLDRACPV
jgi:hypothetical protein